MSFKFLILIFMTFLSSFDLLAAGRGGGVCDSIFRTSRVGCESSDSSNTSGGSFPLLFDAFNFSPSALPTFDSPVGVEAYYNSKKLNFAFIKGFDGLGFGATSKQSNTTFFSGTENYKIALANLNTKYQSSMLGKYINLGTAISTLKIPDFFSLPIGLSYRYNPEIKKWTLIPGFEFRTPYFSVGASYYTEVAPKYSDSFYDLSTTDKVLSLNASSKIENLIFSYSLIQDNYSADYYVLNSNTLTTKSSYVIKTTIYSFTYVFDGYSLTGAYRVQGKSNLISGYASPTYKTGHLLVGSVYKTDSMELGAYYNYVLNNDISAILKIYF